MMLKKLIRKILSKNTEEKLRAVIKYVRTKKNRNVITENISVEMNIYELFNKNVFCGYYDLNPEKNDRILAHVLPKKAKHDDNLELGYFDKKDNKFHKIADTFAWSWQQGSRLRWSLKEDEAVYYNAYKDGRYITVHKNLKTGEETFYPVAFYDISSDERMGVSINFARLQRLRPGYGYSCMKDFTKGQNAPKDDGLFLYNMRKNEQKMLISLDVLADLVDEKHLYQHYLNHIAFSPDSEKIMFFHLWDEKKNNFSWRNRLYVYDILTNRMILLESEDLVSHYVWIDNENLLVTGKDEHGGFYRVYNINSKETKTLKNNEFKKDGHPVMISADGVFCSDTYPGKDSFQTLFMYDLKTAKYNKIMKLYSDPLLYGERRCDLHPKYDAKSNAVLVDSTYSDGQRKIIEVKLKEKK